MPTEPLSLTPTLDVLRQAHPDRPEERCSLHSAPLPPLLRPRRWWGRGRRHPAVALPGSATPLLWQRFPSELVAARARLGLPRSLSPPSYPPVWTGGGAARCPGRGPGGDTRLGLRATRREGHQPEDHLPPALCSRPARSRRGTHGPRHPPRTRLPASGQAAQRTEPQAWSRQRPRRADSGNESRSERWAGGAGRAHGRVLSLACARAQPTEAPPTPCHTPPRLLRGKGWVGLRTHLPHPGAAEDVCSQCRGHPSTEKVHSVQLPGNRLPKGAGGEGHTGGFAAIRRRMLSGAAEVRLTDPETHRAQPGHVQTQGNGGRG